jgi:deoxyribose-phosphate aldolase
MITEYSLYDISMSDEEVRQNLKKAADFEISSVSVFNNHIKLAKNIFNDNVKISTPIDYPLGILDSKTRIASIESAIKSGADIINITACPYLLCNRKYDKFREDIKNNLELAQKYQISIRYILEYRVFTYELLYKVAQILINGGIDTIYPSTGYLLDDIHDNILASALINKKVPMINIICNGNIWNIGQIQNIYKTNIYGIKVNSINALKLLQENKLKS